MLELVLQLLPLWIRQFRSMELRPRPPLVWPRQQQLCPSLHPYPVHLAKRPAPKRVNHLWRWRRKRSLLGTRAAGAAMVVTALQTGGAYRSRAR